MEQLAAYIPSLVASLTEGVVVLGEEAGVQVYNPALVEMLGLPGAELLEECLGSGELGQLARQALAGDLVWDQDIQYRKPAGQTCWLRVNTRRLADEAGRPAGVLLTLKEISELKRAERDLWQVEKMTALGRLAASVAHEVRNPLSAIDIQLQLLQEDLGGAGGELAARVSRRLNIARTEMRRLEGIVQNFLRFSRPPALHLQQVQPNDLLRHLFSLVEPEAREHGIALVLDLEEPLPAISADENLLSQALLNILINAFQALGTRPRVILRSRLDRVKGQIALSIIDNGRGIPAADLERVLEFYYTTKDEGTGLGLSIAQRIVHQHGGVLEVSSQEGMGTSVNIRLWLEKGPAPASLAGPERG
jgi:PAS domain S-box-containing protein